MRASLLVISLLAACGLASRGRPSRATLNSRITRGRNGDCSFTSVNGSLQIQGYGNAGRVRFIRNVPKRRGSGTIAKWVEVRPVSLREMNPSGQAVAEAVGFGSSTTTVTWNCGVATEAIVDANGNPSSIDVLQSQWASTNTQVRPPGRRTTALAQRADLGFDVRLFSDTFVVDLCPRKYNVTGFGRNAFWANRTGNCSAVEVPGAGIKWSMLIEKWPYASTANHLELRIRVSLNNKFSKRNSRRGARRQRLRRQAALQIVDFGEGSLENPEEVQEVCPDGTTTRPITVTDSQVGRSAQVEITYTFPSPTNTSCNLYYDPVMTMNNADGTSGAERVTGGVVFGMIVALVYALV